MRLSVLGGRVERERYFAGECEVERAAEAVNVRTRVDLITVDVLLGRNVVGRTQAILAEDHGHREFLIVLVHHGESEIEDLDGAIGPHEKILGLDIPMYQSLSVHSPRRMRPGR